MQITARSDASALSLADAYIGAKEYVIEHGFAGEIDWQDSIHLADVTESTFLSEAAWVVLSSGMRESIIRRIFPSFSGAFFDWESSELIYERAEECRVSGNAIFRHKGKVDAIIKIAEQVDLIGFDSFKNNLELRGVEFIQLLPFMGPATSFHLAKNIGLDVVKPDRHLKRVAGVANYENPDYLCSDISRLVGDRLSVIDIVIWRFATLNPDYMKWFGST